MENLAYIDWGVLAVYLVILIVIGVITGRKERNTEDYFLGGRKMPWWAVMVSIYATSLSALTFIGVPGAAYAGDFYYLQLGIGNLCGQFVIAFLLLTAYYKAKVTTVYELLEGRFGPRTRDAGTGFFIVGRILASGVRLAGCAIAIHVVFDVEIKSAIAVIATVAVFYTFTGGIKAVIWTDMLQFILFITAATIALGTVIYTLPNGFDDFLRIASENNKFTVFHDSLNPKDPNYWLNINSSKSFIAGIFFGFFTVIATLGTDQDLVQRMLTCKTVEESQRSLLLTGILNFPVTLLFLSIGTAVFVFYKVNPDPVVMDFAANSKTDHIFPHFIKTVLAPGLRGLLIAGLLAAAMSSLDSALNALASTAYIDIYKRYISKDDDDSKSVYVSRVFVAIFGMILASVAILFSYVDSILWFGFKIFGYLYGASLGIFLLAVLTKRKFSDLGNMLAMIISVFAVIWFTADHPYINNIRPFEPIIWQWSVIIGMVTTMVYAYIFSLLGNNGE